MVSTPSPLRIMTHVQRLTPLAILISRLLRAERILLQPFLTCWRITRIYQTDYGAWRIVLMLGVMLASLEIGSTGTHLPLSPSRDYCNLSSKAIWRRRGCTERLRETRWTLPSPAPLLGPTHGRSFRTLACRTSHSSPSLLFHSYLRTSPIVTTTTSAHLTSIPLSAPQNHNGRVLFPKLSTSRPRCHFHNYSTYTAQSSRCLASDI